MQGAALRVGQIIPVVVSNQVDNRPFGQGCRLVKNKPALLDPCSERTHTPTLYPVLCGVSPMWTT